MTLPKSTTSEAAIKGYTPVSENKRGWVNTAKELEERVLRHIDMLNDQALYAKGPEDHLDTRFLAIAKTDIQKAFMALNRGIMNPQRISLSGDDAHP